MPGNLFLDTSPHSNGYIIISYLGKSLYLD